MKLKQRLLSRQKAAQKQEESVQRRKVETCVSLLSLNQKMLFL